MDRPLLSLRSALIFLLALLTGGAASGLTAVAGEGTARSLLAGLAATGLAVPFFNRLIAAEDDAVRSRTAVGAGTVEEESHG
ncbi:MULTISPECIES: hypothetical protein [Streptomyces]|uniref:Uncharacterized protein n=2 Tax=Streptomyces TaxID=1883 RepID=A0AA40VHX5_9ACTN|nr:MULTISPECIES: hypothetical protein [Streptomyces]MBA8944450.1 hypothetical protein [Streptomyces calvus]MBA8976812.1 hypothetical protein [Streptomyces calvus]GGP55718.1 hypothetical protein GCM10010247_30570 [Streptomyces calvus]